MTMAKKTQKDIHCGNNSDGDKIVEMKEDKDPGVAVKAAITAAETKANGERVNFRAYHCPLKTEQEDCTKKENLKGDKDDIVTTATVSYNKVKKVWVAEATSTWSASFDCVKA